MYCQNCGKELLDSNDKYCRYCGNECNSYYITNS